MSQAHHETPVSILEAFERALPTHAMRMKRDVARRLLESVYADAREGRPCNKTQQQLKAESRAAGIAVTEYEVLVTLSEQAADGRWTVD